jgi:hypothetical protein
VDKVNNRAVLPWQSTQAEIGKALVCNLLCRRRAVLLFDTTSISIFSPAPYIPSIVIVWEADLFFSMLSSVFEGFLTNKRVAALGLSWLRKILKS